MNWYKTAKDLSKIAQIWHFIDPNDPNHEYQEDESTSFSGWIKEMYEMEYKYSMMSKLPFNGHPKRKENILNMLKQSLVRVTEQIKVPLEKTIEDWLSKHALLSPNTWAKARVAEFEEMGDQPLDAVIDEYANYSKYSGRVFRDSVFSKMMEDAMGNLDSYPSLKRVLDTMLSDTIEGAKEYVVYNLDDFNLSHGTSFSDIEEAFNWIDSTFNINTLNIDLETFTNINIGDIEPILIELHQNLVFPLWYQYWSDQGIDEVRENAEKSYDELRNVSSSDIGDMVAKISIALNLVHMTGDMIEYVERYTGDIGLKKVLNDMTEGTFVDKANKELRSVGVQI
jgi:hypothetical protein